MKQKVLFAMLMAIVTTGIISFTLLTVNLGWVEGFVWVWIKSWGIAYVIAIPVILLLSPGLQRLAAYLGGERPAK